MEYSSPEREASLRRGCCNSRSRSTLLFCLYTLLAGCMQSSENPAGLASSGTSAASPTKEAPIDIGSPGASIHRLSVGHYLLFSARDYHSKTDFLKQLQKHSRALQGIFSSMEEWHSCYISTCTLNDQEGFWTSLVQSLPHEIGQLGDHSGLHGIFSPK